MIIFLHIVIPSIHRQQKQNQKPSVFVQNLKNLALFFPKYLHSAKKTTEFVKNNKPTPKRKSSQSEQKLNATLLKPLVF